VEKWREIVKKIMAGEDPGPFQFPVPPPDQQAKFGGSKTGERPGERYIKI
jgi:hypothetical protein